jgi:peptidoglycan hydrolase-like protein with peptidoglycan-binding domain
MMARTVPSFFPDLPTIYNLTFSVGPNCANNFVDVLLVQSLMKLANFTRFTQAMGPTESSANIKVDGFFGPQTARLIKAFEADRISLRLLLVADGVFEPSHGDGFTKGGVQFKIIHLNRMVKQRDTFGNAYNQLPTDPFTHPALRAALQPGMSQA